MKHLNKLSAVDAAAAVAAKRISSVELVEACLAQIGQREPTVGAWACLDREQVLRDARECDAGPPRGPLHGVPVGVKDNIDTRDLPTEYGSRIYRGHRPQRNAACVNLARRAGGIIMGKTVTTEFAMFEPNKTANPHNPSHTPGGSSSGSAAAVADFHVPVAFGTQSAGSIIRPSAFCGVVGYKPTFNTFAPDGIKPIGASLDTLGMIVRSVGDLQLMWNVLQGHAAPRLAAVQQSPRIGLCRTPFWYEAATEQRMALDLAGARLANAGFVVEEIVLPGWFRTLNDLHARLMAYEVARNHVFEFDVARRDLLGKRTIAQFELGWSISPEEYLEARATLSRARKDFEFFCEGFDAIMTPASPGEAPPIAGTGDPVFNSMWTLLGVPAVTLPVGVGPKGLPIGVQFVARTDDDLALLEVCRRMEVVFSDRFDCR